MVIESHELKPCFAHHIVPGNKPPSIRIFCAVMYDARRLHRNAQAAANSAGWDRAALERRLTPES